MLPRSFHRLVTKVGRFVTKVGLVAPVLLAVASCASKAPVEILLVHTGDVRGSLRRAPPGLGAAVVATEMRRLARTRPDLIRVDAGGFSDAAQTSPEAAYAIAAMLGYDAAALGAPEIGLGRDGVERLCDLVPFPLLGSNVVDDAGRPLGDAPYVVIERRGLRIALIGVVSRRTTPPDGHRVIRPRDALGPIVAELAGRAEIVVVLAHAGVDECGRIARDVPGLTLVVGGAGHEPIGEPVAVGGAWVAHASDRLLDVGRVELVWDPATKRVANVRGGTGRPEGPAAPDVLEAVDAVDSVPRPASPR